MPGVAGLQTIMSNHGPHHIGHPKATFGITEGNPLWEELSEIAARAGPSFILNVTLNEHREITAVFAGDMIAAHRAGCEYVRSSAMQAFEAPFDLVVSTNSGYPLDLNLYQTVKGMTAAARVLKPGGTMVIASECREGVPSGSSYETLLHSESCPGRLLAKISTPGFRHPEQWQAQLQAAALGKGKVFLHSSLPDEAVRAAHLQPCHDVQKTVQGFLLAHPNGARIAVLPEGPLTIPYLREARN
jgi:nickel-dependent lactate racemase